MPTLLRAAATPALRCSILLTAQIRQLASWQEILYLARKVQSTGGYPSVIIILFGARVITIKIH